MANALAAAFDLPPFQRGRRIETLLGAGGLSPNYPRFDRTDHRGGSRFEFISIKSRDLRAARYRSLAAFKRLVQRDIDAIANIRSIPQWRHLERKISLIPFDRSLGECFALEVVVYGADRHPDFGRAIAELKHYAVGKDTVLRVFPV